MNSSSPSTCAGHSVLYPRCPSTALPGSSRCSSAPCLLGRFCCPSTGFPTTLNPCPPSTALPTSAVTSAMTILNHSHHVLRLCVFQARSWAPYEHYLIYLPQLPYSRCHYFHHFIEGKLRLAKERGLTQGHTAGKRQHIAAQFQNPSP